VAAGCRVYIIFGLIASATALLLYDQLVFFSKV